MKDKHVRGNKGMRLRSRNTRPTIGLLGLLGVFSDNAAQVTRRQDVNQIGFSCGAINSPYGFEAQANVLADLAGTENIDGLIIWSDSIGHFATTKEIQTFCEQFRPLPIISVGSVQGFPNVLIDNYQGSYQIVTHLIAAHHHRRIVCIRGPEKNAEAEQRYRGYVDALAEHNIPFDRNLVVLGGFKGPSGIEAMNTLLDERGLDFDALVAPTDEVAITAIEMLLARGIRVPEDVAVVGFDDEASDYMIPLTSVHAQWYEAGAKATELLLALMAGKEVPERTLLSSHAVVRQSCGCHSPVVTQAAAGPMPATGEPFEALSLKQREIILSAMAQTIENTSTALPSTWLERLLDAFIHELHQFTGADVTHADETSTSSQAPGSFISTLDEILQQTTEGDDDAMPIVTSKIAILNAPTRDSEDPTSDQAIEISTWQQIISALRRHTKPYLTDVPELLWAEDLWQQARVLAGKMTQRSQAHKRALAIQRTHILRQVSQALTTSPDIDGLIDTLCDVLPQLGIPGCYLGLYQDPQAPAGWARMIFAYDQGKRIALDQGSRRFPSRHLVPGDLLPQDRRYEFYVKALFFREEQIGFILFEPGPRDRTIYEMLSRQISNALRGALLMQQVARRSLQLQTAAEVSQAASSALELNKLIQQTVDLARERFNLYYVGLFLVDEKREWAVLQAGTGEAGREMLRRGHKLQIGGTSMIGSCVARRQARIALDVGKEAARFDNPLLPLTRSELVLPLISRGRTIGALTIQSSQETAFNQQDITVFQTMADQLANTIENARLFERTQTALAEVDATHRQYLEQAWTAYLQTGQTTTYETARSNVTPLGNTMLPQIEQVIEQQSTIVYKGSGGQEKDTALITPLALRGAVIGALGIHDEDGERQWTASEIALVEAVVERMTLTAENLRLLSNTQRRANRERLIREVSDQIQRATDIEGLMHTTAEELSRFLGNSRVSVQLSAKAPSTPLVDDERTDEGDV